MNIGLIGYGSFFHEIDYQDLSNEADKGFLNQYQLYYTGRHAIRHLIDTIALTKKIDTIWLPKYYCQHVTHWLKQVYHNIEFYHIDPFDPKKSFDWKNHTNTNDVIILNNFWGLYSYEIPSAEKRPIVIEDHSHGWLSNGCKNSTADFCFSSLRKTLPVPLGGIVWIPEKSNTNIKINDFTESNIVQQEEFITNSWEQMTRAMHLKRKCESLNQKEQYLRIYNTAEQYLHEQHEVIPVKKEHNKFINNFLFKDYTTGKKKNLFYIYEKIEITPFFKIIKKESQASFGLQLAFKSRSIFDDLKTFLVSKSIYPSELWPNNTIECEFKYLMNIHVDFRYTSNDMEYISTNINEWLLNEV